MNKIFSLFLGSTPNWYKGLVIAFLMINPAMYFTLGPFLSGWAILIEFLLVLVFALKSYPLFPGGLLALEVMVLKMAPLESVMKEIHGNIDIIMLLMFMIPAIFFMKPLLVWIFIRVISATKDKVVLSLVFLVAGAFLSAWLDALTLMAVMISVCAAVKDLYSEVKAEVHQEAEEFNGFLRNLLMHGAVGTALGGVATLIGEPQNILIAHYAGWRFREFYVKMAPFSIPLQIAGVMLCWVLERFRVKAFGFGYQLPSRIGQALEDHARKNLELEDPEHKTRLLVMAAAFVCLTLALGLQIAPVGIIGLGLLICLPVLTGQTNEHVIGRAFEESMPFTCLLIVFFVIVAMIENLGLFHPLTSMALQFKGKGQLYAFFLASGILSSVSDNVFVASVFIHEAFNALTQGVIDKVQFDRLAIMINAGTNIFSIATPNGQAAFLFLLTSAMARRVGLSYVRMFKMSFPYAVVLIGAALALV